VAYRSSVSGNVFALRWLTSPTSPDLKALGKELTEQRRRVGSPLVNLSLVPADVSPPEGSVRKEMERFNQIFTEVCSAIHVVVGGTGFRHAVLRSIVSAFALAAGKRGLVKVHRSLDEALREIAGGDAKILHKQLETEELLEGL